VSLIFQQLPMVRRPILLSLLLAVLAAVPALAQGAPPADPTAPQIHVLTFGPGDAVWEKFGHNAIWVHDPEYGTDHVYNWGVFDFDSPGYWSRFVKGDWIYELGVSDLEQTVWAYEYMNRSIAVQTLNLTPAESRELRDFLLWNARPENREYRYDYYYDNCSTRVRDVIDRTIGGRLRAATEAVPTDESFRSHSRRLIQDDRAAYTGMNAGLGPAADRPISAWEEMFLPEKVQARLREIRVPDAEGNLVPLVARERVVFTANRAPEPAVPPRWTLPFLLVGTAVGGALIALAHFARRSAAARFGFAAVGSLWTLLVGTGGLLLVALWALTNHTIAHRNENLLHLDPLALLLVLLVRALAYGARWAARPARWIVLATAALSGLGLLLHAANIFDQVNGAVIALLLPTHLALAWAVWKLSAEPAVALDAAVEARSGRRKRAPARTSSDS
jgi:hypothetical protein